jgi:hypothetical protein
MRVEFVPATHELVAAWYGRPAPFSLRGYAGVAEDGRVMGLCGIYSVGPDPVAFSEWRPEVDKRTLARGVRLIERMLKAFPIPVYAVPSDKQPTSVALLKRLGFVETGDQALGGPLMIRVGG